MKIFDSDPSKGDLILVFCVFGRTVSWRNTMWVAVSLSNACLHAKSLQLCPTLCSAMDSSPPGSSVHRSFHARTLEWVAITYKQFLCFLWSPTVFHGDGQMYLVNFISSLSSVGNYIGMPWVPCIMDMFNPIFMIVTTMSLTYSNYHSPVSIQLSPHIVGDWFHDAHRCQNPWILRYLI